MLTFIPQRKIFEDFTQPIQITMTMKPFELQEVKSTYEVRNFYYVLRRWANFLDCFFPKIYMINDHTLILRVL